VHEVGDGVVPYYTQQVSVIGLPTGLVASGSHDIHVRLNNLGVPNCFLSYPGNGHVGYLSSDAANAIAYVALFSGELSCGQATTCGELPTAVVDANMLQPFSAYPNPTTGPVRLLMDLPGVLTVNDMSGREVMRKQVLAGECYLDLTDLPSGVFVIRVEGRPEVWTRIVRAD
jgi:hypothetical protein